MFKRVIFENWSAIGLIISFVFMFTVFAYTTIRALRIAETRRDHLASLPLDSHEESTSSHIHNNR
jgi:hypothetical protein